MMERPNKDKQLEDAVNRSQALEMQIEGMKTDGAKEGDATIAPLREEQAIHNQRIESLRKAAQ